MEPATLNSPREKVLEDWLCNRETDTLTDDGFTQRVMTALPPPAPRTRWENRQSLALVTAGTLLGCWIAARYQTNTPDFHSIATTIASTASDLTQSVADPAVLLMLVVTAGSLLLTSSRMLVGVDPL